TSKFKELSSQGQQQQQQQQQTKYNPKSSKKQSSNVYNLVELSRAPQLPIRAILNCFLKNAILMINPTTQIPWIRFEINDNTANCQAMSSESVFNWIYNKFADQKIQGDINQFYSLMIFHFMNQWGHRNVSIDIELVSPTDIPIIHRIF
ncbi:hypothetical protein RFI_37421, partial [Reticulomyxa filosa]